MYYNKECAFFKCESYKGCKILVQAKCQDCSFFKTQKQYMEDKEKARQILMKTHNNQELKDISHKYKIDI